MYTKMKKSLCIVSIAGMLSTPLAFADTIPLPNNMINDHIDAVLDMNKSSYQIGEESKDLKSAPYIKKGIPMIGLEDIIHLLNMNEDNVEYKKDKVILYHTKKIIEIYQDSNQVIASGQKIDLATPCEMKDDTMMVPIDFIEKILDQKVTYNSITKKISIPVEYDKKLDQSTFDHTYEELLEKAYRASRDLKSADMNEERADIIRDDAKDDVDYEPLRYGNGLPYLKGNTAYLKFKKEDLEYRLAKKSIEKIKECIAYDLKCAYDGVLRSLDDEKIAKLGVELSRRKADLTHLNYAEGLASEMEDRKAQRSYEESKKQLELANKQVIKSYEKLNDLVRLPMNERYSLKDDIDFEGVLDEDITAHISRAIDKSVDIWALKEMEKLQELNEDLHVFNLPVDYKWSFDMKPYESKKMDVKMTDIQIGKVKQQYDQGMRQLYTSLKQLKDQYEQEQISYEKSKEDLKLSKINVEIGNELPIVQKKAAFEVENHKRELRKIMMDYNEYFMQYEKPWVVHSKDLEQHQEQ